MYEVNGTPMLLMPESGGWNPREVLGTDGQGRPIYSPLYSYRLSWSPMSPAQAYQIFEYFTQVSVTGTMCMVLPTHPRDPISVSYTGTSYCGVMFEEPIMDRFWEENLIGISVQVVNITI